MKFVALVAGLLKLAFVANCDGEDENWYMSCETEDQFYIVSMGDGGKFAYKTCNATEWLEVQVSNLAEVNANGEGVDNSIDGFSNGVWYSNSSTDKTLVEYSYTSENGVEFTLYTKVLTQTEKLSYGTGYANDLKFGFKISGWQFLNTTNSLVVECDFEIVTPDNGGDNSTNRRLLDSEMASNATGEWSMQGFTVLVPGTATLYSGSGSSEIQVGVTKQVEQEQATFFVTLPYFASNAMVDYDPLVRNALGAASDASTFSGIAAIALAVLFGIVF
jgi:hypothetical protein